MTTQPGTISTAPFAKQCRIETFWPGAWAMHREQRVWVGIQHLPAAVLDALRAEGVGDRLDDASVEIPLGEAILLDMTANRYGPRPHIPFSELVASIRAWVPTAIERAESVRLQAKAEADRARQLAEKRAAEDQKMRALQAAEAVKAEAQRRQNPAYVAKLLEQKLAALEAKSG